VLTAFLFDILNPVQLLRKKGTEVSDFVKDTKFLSKLSKYVLSRSCRVAN
jgi:hypothetical protein